VSETELHRCLVGELIAYFRQQGFTILAAAADGYQDPSRRTDQAARRKAITYAQSGA
jgi:hypothetical protein